jgi:hypothetical protein
MLQMLDNGYDSSAIVYVVSQHAITKKSPTAAFMRDIHLPNA